MNKEELKKGKALATKKLKEFQRWRAVAQLPKIELDEAGSAVKLYEFDPEDYENRPMEHLKIAPYEVNEIIRAVNGIEEEQGRRALIMTYLTYPKVTVLEQEQILLVSETQYYVRKGEALIQFFETYRGGELWNYME